MARIAARLKTDERLLRTFSPQALANTAMVFARREPADLPLMHAIADVILQEGPPEAFTAQGLALVAEAYAISGIRHEALMQYIAEQALRPKFLATWKAEDVAMVVWAFAKVGVWFDQALEAIVERALQGDLLYRFTPQELAITVWALGRCHFYSPGFMDAAADRMLDGDFLLGFNAQVSSAPLPGPACASACAPPPWTPPPLATTHNPYPCAPRVGKGTQHAQQGHKGEGRGDMMRSPKGGLSTGIWRQEVVMCPRRGKDPASGHPRAHQPPLARGTSPPAWDGRLDAPGQRQRQLPSFVWTRHREVKQGKSRGSVGTTDQGKGKERSGERPMDTTAYGGKGQGGDSQPCQPLLSAPNGPSTSLNALEIATNRVSHRQPPLKAP